MATIKAIEAKSVHQIQSGQVIVDLCSVAKELVENSLDAGATSVEVRFKNNGLDSIEVQDNGSGVAPANYESIALKHYTSKLSNYDDLSSLQTFGFRGEALSSLCALSRFSIVTAQADEAPKGKRLDFDPLGKLKSTTVVAAQKGTTATVENLFENLPVRRKELTKNVKREYGKVLGLLHAYACISVNVKFTVKNAMPKAKSMTVFSTKGNATTRENIANVYGAKTLGALAPLDLELDFQPTLTQLARKDKGHTQIQVRGHISKPVFGEGRQTPDRQMFFVNGRPCGLPQIAKAINEVYKAFNVSQSPFVFADLQMDTNAYDVNVSPDKRTILLHDSGALIENLKTALSDMFDQQDQTVPQSQLPTSKLPAFQKLSFQRRTSSSSPGPQSRDETNPVTDSLRGEEQTEDVPARSLFRDHFQNFTSSRREADTDDGAQEKIQRAQEKRAERIAQNMADKEEGRVQTGAEDDFEDLQEVRGIEDRDDEEEASPYDPVRFRVRDFNARLAEARAVLSDEPDAQEALESAIHEHGRRGHPADNEGGVVMSAFDRMRPKRVPAELATVTVGDQTITTVLGTQIPRAVPHKPGMPSGKNESKQAPRDTKGAAPSRFSQRLSQFGAQGTEISPSEETNPPVEQSSVDSEPDDAGGIGDGSQDDIAAEESDDDDVSISDEASPEHGGEAESDDDYIDELTKKKAEEAKVAALIRAAEESSTIPTRENLKRATRALGGGATKDSTSSLFAVVEFSPTATARLLRQRLDGAQADRQSELSQVEDDASHDPETRLSLTVSKSDFAKMRIVGQFNLGFIVAVRPGGSSSEDDTTQRAKQHEMFIIDQHASDEKYNFERLQAETIVGNQRLVRPVTLDLTAVEEEVVLENQAALEKNGFLLEVDTSGEKMVGQRCNLVSLPLSKEVVFNIRDLEELIQLLAEAPGGGTTVPRPSKVRKMFAMRACRSSIMIGKTLSQRQMEKTVAHMGTIDKPWNCPHGRPTMRHLCGLSAVQPWQEGGGDAAAMGLGEVWRRFLAEGD